MIDIVYTIDLSAYTTANIYISLMLLAFSAVKIAFSIIHIAFATLAIAFTIMINANVKEAIEIVENAINI